MVKIKLEIDFLPRAAQDLDEILSFIQSENYPSIERFYEGLENAIMSLADFPYKGHLTGNQELFQVRFRVLRFKNYSVYYKLENDKILICRILHDARDRDQIINN